jgi:hypothetical protein
MSGFDMLGIAVFSALCWLHGYSRARSRDMEWSWRVSRAYHRGRRDERADAVREEMICSPCPPRHREGLDETASSARTGEPLEARAAHFNRQSPIADSRLPIADSRLPKAEGQSPIADSQGGAL